MNEADKIEIRNTLKMKLGYGDMNKVAEIAGVSRWTVIEYFKGNNDNYNVQLAVEGVISNKEAKIKERIESQS